MDMDITLIVKASNQQFEDQTIKCEPSWTIRRLKGHLTEVYPGKPSTDEQKLIYSGQLLGDSVVLKDILRHYDGQKTHTVHLVFTPKNNRFQKEASYASGSSSSSSNSNNSRSMSPKVNETTVPAGSSSSSGSSTSARPAGSDIVGADGLRQRNVAQGATPTAPVATCPTSMTPATNNFMEHHLAMQNLMQQAYMQYLNQYMNVISGQTNAQALYASAPTNLPAAGATTATAIQPQSTIPAAMPTSPQPIVAQTLPNLAYYPYLPTMNSSMPSASSIPAPITSSGTIPTSSASSAAAAAAASAGPSSSQSPTIPSGAPQIPGTSPTSPPPVGTSTDGAQTGQSVPPQAADANVAPAAAAPAGGAVAGGAAPAPAAARRFPNIVVEEQENRDWLDIFFSMCRVGILMTVVYLYSSPVRCLTVLFIGIALYLYQIGFFRTNDPMERARRLVVQEINNAHGIRQNAALRARVARQVAAAAAAAGAAAPAGGPQAAAGTAAAAEPNATSSANEAAADQTDADAKEGENNATVESAAEGGETAPLVEAGPEQQLEGEASNAVQEANRVNLNDVAGFLRTLVLSFFTSIIPDTPAA